MKLVNRFAIADSNTDWSNAEAQIARLTKGGKGGRSSVVSIRTDNPNNLKRKLTGETNNTMPFEVEGEKKKTRRGKKVKR